jgi:hypothetical protein
VGNFVTTKHSKDKNYYKQKAKQNWDRWRLLFCDYASFTYTEVFCQMTDEEVMEANCALDIVDQQVKAQMKKK